MRLNKPIISCIGADSISSHLYREKQILGINVSLYGCFLSLHLLDGVHSAVADSLACR